MNIDIKKTLVVDVLKVGAQCCLDSKVLICVSTIAVNISAYREIKIALSIVMY